MSFRARQLLKKSLRDALQTVIEQSSRFERFNVVQKTKLPLPYDENGENIISLLSISEFREEFLVSN